MACKKVAQLSAKTGAVVKVGPAVIGFCLIVHRVTA
jgi:hypothetical protein